MLITPTWTSARKASRSGSRHLERHLASAGSSGRKSRQRGLRHRARRRCWRGTEGGRVHDASLVKLVLALAATLLLAWGAWLRRRRTAPGVAASRETRRSRCWVSRRCSAGGTSSSSTAPASCTDTISSTTTSARSTSPSSATGGSTSASRSPTSRRGSARAWRAGRSPTSTATCRAIPRRSAPTPGRCKRHFSGFALGRVSPATWTGFATRIPPERWEASQLDHGYNATPAWTLIGGRLASTGAVSTEQILALALLDPLLAAGGLERGGLGLRMAGHLRRADLLGLPTTPRTSRGPEAPSCATTGWPRRWWGSRCCAAACRPARGRSSASPHRCAHSRPSGCSGPASRRR